MKLVFKSLDHRDEFHLVRGVAFVDRVVQHDVRFVLDKLHRTAKFIGLAQLPFPYDTSVWIKEGDNAIGD